MEHSGEFKKINPESLLNWAEISRYRTGSSFKIRKRSIPDSSKQFVSDMIKAVEKVLKKHEKPI